MSKAEDFACKYAGFEMPPTRRDHLQNRERCDIYSAVLEGYEQAEKDLGWHSVDECLPKIDEEVIVLVDNIHGKVVEGANYICFGHIVDKNIAVDYNGWNIPGVKFWMPCPKIPNEE